MSNTRHIANKPLGWEVGPRPDRPPIPGPSPPVPPPPPPPPPEGMELIGRTDINVVRTPPNIIASRYTQRQACNLIIVNSDGLPIQDIVVWSGNERSMRVYNDCFNTDQTERPIVGGPTFNSEIDPLYGPWWVVPPGGSVYLERFASFYINDNYVTRVGYTIRLRSRTCEAVSWSTIYQFDYKVFGSGLWGFRSYDHWFSVRMSGTTGLRSQFNRIIEEGGNFIDPTSEQLEIFAWLWERPPNLVL